MSYNQQLQFIAIEGSDITSVSLLTNVTIERGGRAIFESNIGFAAFIFSEAEPVVIYGLIDLNRKSLGKLT